MIVSGPGLTAKRNFFANFGLFTTGKEIGNPASAVNVQIHFLSESEGPYIVTEEQFLPAGK